MATFPAASPDRDDIIAAIALCSNGDTVTVPSGSATWTSTVVFSNKNITLQGAGIGSTVITISVTNAVTMSTTTTRVTGFTFNLSNSSYDQIVNARGQGFRVDNCAFNNTTGSSKEAISVSGSSGSSIPHPTGVIDHCTFSNCRVVVEGDTALLAHAIWDDASTIGSADQTGVVYVEDCTFTRDIFGNSMDSNYGGRYVFRYNSVTNSSVEAHSVQGEHRASRSWEIYNNTFNATESTTRPMFLRGGTGVCYNNTITGSYTFTIGLDNVRSFTDLGEPMQECNGLSSWDGNTADEEGWPCRDQIGRGADSGAFPSSQASEPAYFWNNTKSGSPTEPTVVNNGSTVKTGGSSADIVEDRDYFNSARPGYAAYAYPHPLVSAVAPVGDQGVGVGFAF